jgi:hypothetical protein
MENNHKQNEFSHEKMVDLSHSFFVNVYQMVIGMEIPIVW